MRKEVLTYMHKSPFAHIVNLVFFILIKYLLIHREIQRFWRYVQNLTVISKNSYPEKCVKYEFKCSGVGLYVFFFLKRKVKD